MTESARRRIAAAGDAWKFRIVANAKNDTPATRRALAAAADLLDEAIGDMLDAAIKTERNRKGTP